MPERCPVCFANQVWLISHTEQQWLYTLGFTSSFVRLLGDMTNTDDFRSSGGVPTTWSAGDEQSHFNMREGIDTCCTAIDWVS
jgi:hypothetical protein